MNANGGPSPYFKIFQNLKFLNLNLLSDFDGILCETPLLNTTIIIVTLQLVAVPLLFEMSYIFITPFDYY